MVKFEKKRRPQRAERRGKSQPVNQPLLLGLPAEVRNEIFNLALSAAGTVRRVGPGTSRARKKSIFCDIETSIRGVNRLKYVNRQLYKETAGIETLYNKIVFDNLKPQASTRIIFLFAKRCAPAKLMWLRYVVTHEKIGKQQDDVSHYLKANMKNLVDLLEFCAANVQITVNYRVLSWVPSNAEDEFSAYRFLTRGFMMELLFWNRDYSHLAPDAGDSTRAFHDDLVNDGLGEHKSSVEALRMSCSNSRFYPGNLAWNKAKFSADTLRTWQEVATDPDTLSENAVDTWVECVQRWMSYGA